MGDLRGDPITAPQITMNKNNKLQTRIARRLRHAMRAAHLGLAGVLLSLVFLAPAQAQINFRAAGAQSAGKGASITPALPAGVQAGDLALLIIAGRPTNTTQPAAPAGWTAQRERARSRRT